MAINTWADIATASARDCERWLNKFKQSAPAHAFTDQFNWTNSVFTPKNLSWIRVHIEGGKKLHALRATVAAAWLQGVR